MRGSFVFRISPKSLKVKQSLPVGLVFIDIQPAAFVMLECSHTACDIHEVK